MIKVVRSSKLKPRRNEGDEEKAKQNKRACIEDAARDLGSVLTLREKGGTEIDPRPMHEEDPGSNTPLRSLEPEETELEEIPLVEGTEKTIQIGKTLSAEVKAELSKLMKENADMFAWTAADMPGIDPATITHKLNVVEGSKPVK
ncbi:unnamed protein product [Amaranthus hypochondriacus]